MGHQYTDEQLANCLPRVRAALTRYRNYVDSMISMGLPYKPFGEWLNS
jgi:hypothetical protein